MLQAKNIDLASLHCYQTTVRYLEMTLQIR